MTLKDIKASVEIIRALSGDIEGFRSEEDQLYRAFIQEVATSGPNSFDCPIEEAAKEVLKTREIPFSRWCA